LPTAYLNLNGVHSRVATLKRKRYLKEKDPFWYEVMQLVAHDEAWDQTDVRELFDQAVAFEPESKLLPQSLLWTWKSGMRKALSTILVTGPMLTRRAGDVAGEGFAKKRGSRVSVNCFRRQILPLIAARAPAQQVARWGYKEDTLFYRV
jgi:hypothetical protein